MIKRWLKNIKNLLTKRGFYKTFKACWKGVNSPIILLIITLIIGNYYLPKVILNYQINYEKVQLENNQKYDYSVKLLDLSWKRLFLAKNFFWNYKENTLENRKIDLWSEYFESTKEWNYKIGSNIFAINKYYGPETQAYFNKEVNLNFIKLHEELLKIRFDEKVDIVKIETMLSTLDNRVYIFAEKVSY